jgi:serine/threonine protein kinase/alpha-tubulin suppressor-like RCC1 family protein
VAEGATLPEVRELEAEYEILAELGRGGMSVVYLARDRELGRDVAIKVIHAAMGVDDAVVARQLSEARTVAQLQHPNVVAIHAVKRLSTRGLALVMQYVPGRSLGRAIHEDGRFSPERTEAVLTDIAAALAYAHARGVVHRDVKPENIFLNDETGRALLSDFGIALSAEAGRQEPNADLLVGTPAYMSPEQIDGVVIDGRSDLFSLGIIGHEMLMGIRPWVDDPVSDVMYRQKFEALPSIAAGRADVPERLRTVLERAVQKERDARWESAGAFLGALTDDEWVAGSTSPAGGQTTNRLAAHLAGSPRATQTPAASPAPLETVQFRRPAVATPPVETVQFRRPAVATPPEGTRPPHRGMFTDQRRTTKPTPVRRGRQIAVWLGLPVAVLAAAAAAMQFDPGLKARAQHLVDRAPATPPPPVRSDSVDEALMEAVRDSATRAESTRVVRAADSVAAAAAAAADSSSKAHVAAVHDSLVRVRAQAESTRIANAKAVTPPAPAPAPVAVVRPPAPAPAPAVEAPQPIHAALPSPVSAGGAHTCAISASDVLCWGANDRGQLGDGSTAGRTGMARAAAGAVQFAAVSVSADHSCALSRSAAVYCWGANDDGQLGTGDNQDHASPVRVVGERSYKAVAAGGGYSCALTLTGETYCWGRNSYGQLGTGSTASASVPAKVATGVRFVALAASTSHTCALDAVGTAYCWGQNGYGQLGDGSTILRTVPVQVSGVGGASLYFRSIATGNFHTCAVSAEGQPYCWGRNSYGQLGTGGMEGHETPVAVTTNEHMITITAGAVHSCGLSASGNAYCWGRNSYGQLGEGTIADHMTPVKVSTVTGLTAIHASGSHTCAVTVGGATVCWGDNSDGQLGDGSTTHRSTPVIVGGAR